MAETHRARAPGVPSRQRLPRQRSRGEWRAPPKFDSFYIGFERYADSANDQDLWIDDVALSKRASAVRLRRKQRRGSMKIVI